MVCRLLMLSSPLPIPLSNKNTTNGCGLVTTLPTSTGAPILRASGVGCSAARRRVRFNEGEEEEQDNEGERNGEIEMLEVYSQSATREALIVHALVDEEDVEVIVFKGFSSSLSYGTSPDPSTSILPARAVIKFIDRIEGPFDPSNIKYLEKHITWEDFRDFLIST